MYLVILSINNPRALAKLSGEKAVWYGCLIRGAWFVLCFYAIYSFLGIFI